MTEAKLRVAIIGAGASGLPAIRHALLYGVEPVCFEASDGIGGLWRYKSYETPESSVMKTTVINTSKEMTAYSDFPPPGEFANFMHNRKMLEYFERYAEQFKLTDHIRFNHRVDNVERAPSYKQDGKWLVNYTDENGNNHKEEFDGVVLANGHHAEPYWPEKWPGQDSFKGKIIHAHSYKDHRGYEDKVVAVVGVGNSGGDIAVDLSRIAKQVYLITRRGTWVFNRVIDYGEPFDIVLVTRFWDFMRSITPLSVTNWWVHRRLQRRFDHEKYGLKPKHGMFSAHPTVNDELPNRLACGTVVVKPNIKEFTENGLIFVDGTKIDGIDEVILSTGYSFGFPMAEGGKLIPVQENEVSLYQFMYPPELSDHNSLAVLGLIQPLGSIMPISEMQARVYFDVLTGNSKLPSKTEMLDDIQKKRDDMASRYVKSRRHTIQVDYGNYMDHLARMIGCYPDISDYLFTDPQLAFQLFFGPNPAYTYRLKGPHAWPGARDALMTLRTRVVQGMNCRKTPLPAKKSLDDVLNLTNLVIFGILFLILSVLFF